MAVESQNLKSRPMTHAVALTGQWSGLRAVPRTLRTHDHRKRLETGLERLGGLYEAMAYRAALLNTGMERLNGLRAGMINQLDAIDGDPDFEDGGDLEDGGDAEPDSDAEPDHEDEGAQCDDEGHDSDTEVLL